MRTKTNQTNVVFVSSFWSGRFFFFFLIYFQVSARYIVSVLHTYCFCWLKMICLFELKFFSITLFRMIRCRYCRRYCRRHCRCRCFPFSFVFSFDTFLVVGAPFVLHSTAYSLSPSLSLSLSFPSVRIQFSQHFGTQIATNTVDALIYFWVRSGTVSNGH